MFAIVAACLAVRASANTEPALGDQNASVTIVEYGSLTCDYCVKFHREVLPHLKRRHVDSGRIRFIYRDYPTSAAAMRGAVASRCAGSGRYYEMLDALYASVGLWSRARDIDAALVQKATTLGLNATAFAACLGDAQREQRIEQERRRAAKEFGVLGTPTFLVNQRVVRGMKSLKEIEALIAQAEMDARSARPRPSR